ncbi:MAG: hypothetical protein AB7I19_18775 [Planctomycetota bacterium]
MTNTLRIALCSTLLTLVVGCAATEGHRPGIDPARPIAGMSRSLARLFGEASEDLRTLPAVLGRHSEAALQRSARAISAPVALTGRQTTPAMRRLGRSVDRVIRAPQSLMEGSRDLAASVAGAAAVGTSLRRVRHAPPQLVPLFSLDRWPFGYAEDARHETELDLSTTLVDSPSDRD